MVEPASSYFMSGGLRLHYVEWENTAKLPLIMLHGGLDHARSWDWVAASIRKSFHVVALDLRGHGDSQWARGSSYPILEFVSDLMRLIDRLGSRSVSIIGHSLGGAIALYFAGVCPERVVRIVSIEGTWPLEPPAMTVEGRLRKWLERGGMQSKNRRRYANLEEAVTRMRADKEFLSRRQAHHLVRHGTVQKGDGSYCWKFDPAFREMVTFGGDHPLRLHREDIVSIWSNVRAPTLHVSGGQSPFVDPAELQLDDIFQGAHYFRIKEASHWCHHDHLERFLKVARAFLKA